MKHVVQYGIFAAYHLALETSFLADEGASLPELHLNAPITVALPDKPSKIDRSISTIPGFTVPEIEKTPGPQCVSQPQRSMSVPCSDLVELSDISINGNELAKTHNLSAPMSSQYSEPVATFSIGDSFHASEKRGFADYFMSSAARLTASEDQHISCDPGDSNLKIMRSQFCGSRSVPNPLSLQLIGEKILEGQPTLKEEFPPTPSDHQSILVSLSSRCVWKGTVCERSHLLRIKYYGNFDKPLGRFLRDHLFDQVPHSSSISLQHKLHYVIPKNII